MRALFEPFLEAEGFVGKYPNFQRREGEVLQVLSIVHDKWGGGFLLEFACHPPGDLETSWGETIPEDKIDIAYVDPSDRARLVQKEMGSLREGFFRYESFAESSDQCDALVNQLIKKFPQVNAWLRSGDVGDSIAPFAP